MTEGLLQSASTTAAAHNGKAALSGQALLHPQIIYAAMHTQGRGYGRWLH